MALYIAPIRYQTTIEYFLNKHYHGIDIGDTGMTVEEARNLVITTCDDQILVQPAVKLLSPHDAIRCSAWFGTVLQFNADFFIELMSSDHRKNKFLFHTDGVDRNTIKWTLLELLPKKVSLPETAPQPTLATAETQSNEP